MMFRTLALVLFAAFACCCRPIAAAEADNASSELSALVKKINSQLQQGKQTEPELAAELKEFDDLIEKHKDEKTDAAAQIVFMKAMLYLEVLDKSDEGLKLLRQIKQNYPETKPGKNADVIIQHMEQMEAGKAMQRSLVEGAKFPDFDEKDVAGNPLSIGNLKGKVVLIDFWATWCAPCMFELSNVQKVYEKYHPKGLEIIGISLDQSLDRLNSFIKDRNLPWPQFCDGQFWQNKLVQKYGIQKIPKTYLLDGEGKIIGVDLSGDNLDQAVAKAVK